MIYNRGMRNTIRLLFAWTNLVIGVLASGCHSGDDLASETGTVVQPREAGPPMFIDVTEESAVELVHEVGTERRYFFPEIMAPGAALLDYDPRVHFGLGPSAVAERIEVLWPDGVLEVFPSAAADQFLVLTRGEGEGP